MTRIEVYKVRNGKYQAFEDGRYIGQRTYALWVNALKDFAELAGKYNKPMYWGFVSTFQNVVEVIEWMKAEDSRVGYKSVEEYHPMKPVVRLDAVCPGPPDKSPGKYEGKLVEAHDGSVYRIGKYVPAGGHPYYEMADEYDGWELSISAKILDDHLVSTNWKVLS